VARSLGRLTIGGVSYRVLGLDGARGPAFLLRSEAGDVFGLFRHGHEPTRLFASALRPGTPAAVFDGVDLFDDEGRLAVRGRRA
jgi:hypothetical protein